MRPRSCGEVGDASTFLRDGSGSLDSRVELRQNAHSLPPNAKSTRRAREIAHTRDDIVEAAARVFARAGFHEATMAAIAREAGFTAASLYTYFDGKDELYTAILDDLRGGLVRTFEAHLPTGLTFSQQLELLVERQLAFLAGRRVALRLMFDLGPAKSHCGGVERGPAEYLRRMGAFLDRTAGTGLRCSPAEGARVLFAMLQAAFLPWVLGDREVAPDVAATAARVTDLFLNGAAARPS